MVNDFIKVSGNLNMILTDGNGHIKEERDISNLVVTVGKNWIAGRMKDTVSGYTIPTQMTHMGIGIGTGGPVVGDSTLGTEVGTRVSLTTAGGTVSTNTVTYDATFPPGNGTAAITEAGIFTASSGGTMLCRTVFLPVNKAAEDTLTIQWVVTIS